MRLPLPLRAIFGRAARRAVARVTGRAENWTPTDDREGHDWRYGDLETATSAAAMQRAMRSGPVIPGPLVARRDLPYLPHAVIRHAGYLSSALLDWCVEHASAPDNLVQEFGANPAIGPAQVCAVRARLEERLWRIQAAHRVRALWSANAAMDVVPWIEGVHLLLAWVSAHHQDDPSRDWSSFIIRALGHYMPQSPRLLRTVLARPDVPARLIDALLHEAWPDDYEVVGAILRRRPCPASADQMAALFRHLDREDAHNERIVEHFVTAPEALQDACWRSAFAMEPDGVAQALAGYPERVWPGLTEQMIAPLLESASAPVRIAAIQLLATVQVRASLPTPRAAAAPVVSADKEGRPMGSATATAPTTRARRIR